MSIDQMSARAIVPVQTEWTTTDGLRLVGDRRGDPKPPTVLLLHGIGRSRHFRRSAAEALLGAGFSAITVDSRGHGDSDWAPDRNSVRQLVQPPDGTSVGAHEVEGPWIVGPVA